MNWITFLEIKICTREFQLNFLVTLVNKLLLLYFIILKQIKMVYKEVTQVVEWIKYITSEIDTTNPAVIFL